MLIPLKTALSHSFPDYGLFFALRSGRHTIHSRKLLLSTLQSEGDSDGGQEPDQGTSIGG